MEKSITDPLWGSHVEETVLKPMIESGYSAWFSTFTFKSKTRRTKQVRRTKQASITEAQLNREHITPFALNLARTAGMPVVLFVGYWPSAGHSSYSSCIKKSHRHGVDTHAHFHAVIVSESHICEHMIDDVWYQPNRYGKYCDNPYGLNNSNLDSCEHGRTEHKPYRLGLGGLNYIYGKHYRRSPHYFEKPFLPPRCKQTGVLRKPLTRLQRFIGKTYEALPSPPPFQPRIIRRKR